METFIAFLCSLGILSGSYCAPLQVVVPTEYLAQSINPDGNPATPLHASDVMTYRRTDMGGGQIEDSFLTDDGGAITTWSYAPWGIYLPDQESGCPNAPCRGWGGEKEVVNGNVAQIVATQDGSINGVQWFPQPWTVIAPVVDCSVGWTQFNNLERGCHATITFPASGLGLTSITADTIVTEHGDPTIAVERIFLVRGWGRLVWQAYAVGATPVNPSWRCPDFGWNTPPAAALVLGDCREVVNLVLDGSGLSGQYEWHP